MEWEVILAYMSGYSLAAWQVHALTEELFHEPLETRMFHMKVRNTGFEDVEMVVEGAGLIVANRQPQNLPVPVVFLGDKLTRDSLSG